MTEVESGSPEAQLASFAAKLRWEDIPERVRHEARRSLLNVFATALAGCREPAIDITIRAMFPYTGARTATIIGHNERGDAGLAAFVNAMSANIFDFDDTHQATVLHPAAPVFSALFAHAETQAISGAEVLHGFVVGGEVECRIANAVSPYHYARGWHITSTCGVFGAATGVGAMLGLDDAQMLHAMSTAAAQSSGLVETLGTMAKSTSVGGAARNGLVSAQLARNGFTGPLTPLSGQRGYLRVYADRPRLEALTEDLGTEWEIATNTYKPYPGGIVLHPLIDAFLELHDRDGVRLDDVASIKVTGHPLLRERTDRPDVTTGREAQVSAQHTASIVLLRGSAGLDEFTDEAVAETIRAGRPPFTFQDDETRKIESAEVVVHLQSGDTLRKNIKAALGSSPNPLSDAQLEDKLTEMALRVGFKGDTPRLIDSIWHIDDLKDAGDIMRLAAGRE
ncbi:MmgE/PrpD family protein [uncultured Nisaea sp.]|uniref:MmgE/PrpD family protein n=1 Tax=uncultured Nisaea sp. TaxID=538215 RepID=UPI0030EEA07D|tara:strand:+ start:10585 stop:11940 length:1356 start_codon:yes stop_codon:yes gene_type:complete